MDMDHLNRIIGRLKKLERFQEILDGDGNIVPSSSALERVDKDHPHMADTEKGHAEKWRLAQAETVLELARKYQVELN